MSDDWQDGSIVDDFNDIDAALAANNDHHQQQQQQQQRAELPDWDDWLQEGSSSSSSGSGAKKNGGSSSQQGAPAASSPRYNQADEDFFAALERSNSNPQTRQPQTHFPGVASTPDGLTTFTPPVIATPPAAPIPRTASPPMIDLRGRGASQRQPEAQKDDEDDWFARFEKDPTMGGRTKSRSNTLQEVDQSQLDSIQEARDSPMVVPSASRKEDYFGEAVVPARTGSSPSRAQAQHQQHQPPSSSSWWGSIRGLGTDLARHAVDYLDPGVDFTDEELKIARKMGAVDISSQANTPTGSAGATPVRGTTPTPGLRAAAMNANAAKQTVPTPQRKSSTSSASSAANLAVPPVGTTLVSGAPGVDFRSLNHQHWNTGSWSLSENDPGRLDHQRQQHSTSSAAAVLDSKANPKPFRDPLPVNLTGRREETNPVISGFHSSHIQPYLPPRLKLGKTWKLLYSSDQDGVSLETLYRKVDVGLDPKKSAAAAAAANRNGHSSRFDSDRNDAWLRGSSSAARAALGSDLLTSTTNGNSAANRRLGSGLTSISDAGLVLAIRDADDQVFGSYVNEGFKNTKGYYGNGDCFLWRTVQPRGSTPHIQTYPATLLNNYHIQSTSSYISLGGGINGKYGLWMDSSFDKGVSARCETFDNDILCDERDKPPREKVKEERKFEPVVVEIWAVGID